MPLLKVGTNSDREGTGSTNLVHRHYQAGHFDFPILSARAVGTYMFPRYKDVVVEWLRYPCACVRVRGHNGQHVEEVLACLLTGWRSGNIPGFEASLQTFNMMGHYIPPATSRESDAVSLPAVATCTSTTCITPAGRYTSGGEFQITLIPRNAEPKYRTRPSLHCIKHEFVGVFEMAGYAILPARLDGQLKELVQFLKQEEGVTDCELEKDTQRQQNLHPKKVKQGKASLRELPTTLAKFQQWLQHYYDPLLQHIGAEGGDAALQTVEGRVERAVQLAFLDIVADNSPFSWSDKTVRDSWLHVSGLTIRPDTARL